MADAAEGLELGPRTIDVLAAFDGRLSAVASAVARGEYVFWLGSGLSRSVVPDVSELLRKLLSFLQQQIVPSNDACRFRRALNDILDISSIPQGMRDDIDLTAAVESWPGVEDLVQRLVNQYSKALDVAVENEEPDFLVWEGIDVVHTYGSPELEPAAEHLCLAILMLEGVVRWAPSANWDGLIEKAMERLNRGPEDFLHVVVRQEDFMEPEAHCDLIKFHGCALRAGENPRTYRSALTARQSQISGWTTKPEHAVMKAHLEHLAATKAALVVGLSAQDANLHTILHQARENLPRTWPAEPPAVVFALENLGPDQKHVLRITYGDSYAPNLQNVEEEALIGAYALPLLLGLVLNSLADKLCSLISLVQDWDDIALQRLEEGVRGLRDVVAGSVGSDASAFVGRLITAVGIVLSAFRTGSPRDAGDRCYDSLTTKPISHAVHEQNIDTRALGFLAIAASLLGRGVAEGLWHLSSGDVNEPGEGVCTAVGGSGLSRVFLVRDAVVLSQLEGQGHVNMSDPSVLAIHAKEIPTRQVRSPQSRYGRTGKQPAREVAIETIVNVSANADELLASFRQRADL